MLRESAQERIYAEIKNRKLEDHEHIILDYSVQMGVTHLLNHVCKDYIPTEKVDRTLLAELDKFKFVFPNGNRIAFPEHTSKDSIYIWPRANHERTHARYDPRHVEIKMPDGFKTVLWSIFLPARRSEGDVGYYILSYPAAALQGVEDFLTKVSHFLREIQVQEKVLQVHGGSDIRLRGEHCWEDLVLTEDVKHSIKDDLEFWIASEKQYRKKHIPYRRGYLFEGPPGNGKTAVARTILSIYDFAAFSFNFSNIHLNDNDLRQAFENAAAAAPAVFLLEDIDRIFSERMSYSHVTKEGLFNCLDGVSTYSGLIVIATANNPEMLDAAIRLRPGRFDVPVRFSNPGYKQRLEFLQKLLGNEDEHTVSRTVSTFVASKCKGMSMAFIKLVYETAAARVFREQKNLIISSDALMAGFEQAKGYYSQMETPGDRNAGFITEKRRDTEENKPTTDASIKPESPGSPEHTIDPTNGAGPTTYPRPQ